MNGMRGEPKLGKWDYDGRFAPGNPYHKCKRFSVGIFQWVSVAKSQCKRDLPSFLKRGKVVCRVDGLTSEPEMVYELAELLCVEFEHGDGLTEYDNKTYTAERRKK